MKIIIIAILLISGNLIGQTGTIELTISGINPEKGKSIMIAVYDKLGFLDKPIFQKKVKSVGKELTIELPNIEIGKYAIAVYQDENSDTVMNTNFFGKPIELSGFSNNAKGNFGPPDFDDVAFDILNNKSTSITINLKK